MAIQFNCPYCTSPIRVPDSAGGKRGTCPRCKAKILVPKLKRKTSPAATEQPAAQTEPPRKKRRRPIRDRLAETPDFAGISEAETNPAASGEAEIPAFSDVTASNSESAPPPLPVSHSPAPPLPPSAAIVTNPSPFATPYARALRRRQRRRRSVWIPVLFGLLLVGSVAGFLVWTGRQKLEGTLEAVILPDANLQPKTVNDAMVPLEEETVRTVLAHLRKNPLPNLQSDRNLMMHEVVATSSGLSISVFATDSVQFFRVDVRKNKAMRKFLKSNREKLDRPRIEELESGLKRFFHSTADSLANGGGIENDSLDEFRRNVVLPALVGGAGYHLVASVDHKLYLCMYEDKVGRLYFLLPMGTKKFTIVGRKLADGTRLFPGRYTVNVSGPAETGSNDAKTESDPAKPAPKKTESQRKSDGNAPDE